MEDLKKLKIKNWKEIAKDRRTWRDLAQKAKTHKGLKCQMMMMRRRRRRRYPMDIWSFLCIFYIYMGKWK